MALQGAANFADKLQLSHDTNSNVYQNTFNIVGIQGIENNAIFVDDSTGITLQANHIVLSANSTTDTGIKVSNSDQFNVRANTQVFVYGNSVNSTGIGTGLLYNGAAARPSAPWSRATTSVASPSASRSAATATMPRLAWTWGSSATGSLTQSLGGNDFRDPAFTSLSSTSHAAIVLLNVPSTFTLPAEFNMFLPSVSTPIPWSRMPATAAPAPSMSATASTPTRRISSRCISPSWGALDRPTRSTVGLPDNCLGLAVRRGLYHRSLRRG